MFNITAEVDTLVNLAWDTSIDDDTRDSMTSHFTFMPTKDWEMLKSNMKYSDSVKRVIDTIDTLRDMNKALQ